ncbi:MAG: M20 family metallopeptidase [Desulfurococcales archaeon]|nr:M20 family metallopeptidase [Desulfurococcales archaeon]
MTYEVINTLVNSCKNEIIRFLQDLIRAESYNPPGNEAKVAKVIADKLQEVGIEYQIIESAPRRANIIFTADFGGSKTVLFNGHMDVVPPGDLSKWEHDPLSAALVDGRVYGRGATDMKGGLASMIMSIILYMRSEALLKETAGRVIMAATADEEMNSDYGLKYLADVRGDALRADYAVIGEPTGINGMGKTLVIGEKGDYELHVKIHGRKAHSSIPSLGVNAVELACDFVHNLKKLKLPKVKPPIPEHELIRRFAAKAAQIKDTSFRTRLTEYIKALTENIYSATMISGGFKANVIPDECEVVIDFRVLPGLKLEEVTSAVKELLNDLGIKEYGITVPVVFEPSVLEGGGELIEAVREGARKYYGDDPVVTIGSGASDARILRNKLGIKTVLFGPGYGELAHSDNEYVEVEDVLRATKVYMYVIHNLLSRSKNSRL